MVTYTNSFNSGQLGSLMVARTDLPIYQSGCKTLRNFWIKPQGGVEKRQGSRYLLEALHEDSRLIPFIFNRDESYMLEISYDSIRVFGENGNIVDTLLSPYADENLKNIKYTQVGDIMWLVSPNVKPYNIKRISLNPVNFDIEEITFDYPPFLEENINNNIYVACAPEYWVSGVEYPSGSQIQNEGVYYSTSGGVISASTFEASAWQPLYEPVDAKIGDTVILTATSGSNIFTEDMVGGYWRMRHNWTDSLLADGGTFSGGVSKTSNIISVDEIKYTINLTVFGCYATIEHNTGTGWSTVVTHARDTSKPKIVTYNGIGIANELVRVKYTPWYINGYCNYTIGLGTNRRITASLNGNGTTDALDVSFSNWEINTGGIWNGTVELEKSIDNQKTWNTSLIIGDTNNIAASNFTISSKSIGLTERGATFIRVKFTHNTGTLTVNLNIQSSQSEGIARLVEYISPNEMKAVVLNNFGSPAATTKWSEGAFSVRRGYPAAIELHDNRIVYSGTLEEPNTLYFSATDDYYNFQLGTADADAIKIKPATNEPTVWLLSKGGSLYQGTRGSIINIESINGNAITPSNITANESLEFGGSNIQAIKTNETVVFLERLGTKLRELYYSDEQKNLLSRDLTIMSNEIASRNGFTEMVLQKNPDQIIHGLRSDGLVSSLTYERSQEVMGWAVMNFGGEVTSIGILPTETDSELWINIKRTNGNFIEKLGSRAFDDNLLDAWFVDSGVLIGNDDSISGTYVVGDSTIGFQITVSADNTLENGTMITILDDSSDTLKDLTFTVSDASTSGFKLKTSDGTEYVDYAGLQGSIYPTSLTYIGATISGEFELDTSIVSIYPNFEEYNTTRPFYGFMDDTDYYVIGYNPVSQRWCVGVYYDETGFESGTVDITISSISMFPPEAGWNYGSIIDYYGNVSGDLDISFTRKIWTGLEHLEGETVQLVGDGGWDGTYVVSGGQVESQGYYNQAIIGLRYLAILQPMYFESTTYASNRWNKGLLDADIIFDRSIGGYSGILVQTEDRFPEFDYDELEADFPNMDRIKYDMEPINFRTWEDLIGEPIPPFTGSKLIRYNDTWSRIATQFVISDIPLPMTVIGMAINLKIGGS